MWNKSLLCIFAVLVLAACASKPAVAPVDPEVERKQQLFHHMTDHYYAVDKQDFKQISCQVRVPILDQMVGQVRGYLTTVSNDISVTDTLSGYRMTYTPNGGLQVSDPTVDIVIKPTAKLADPAKVQDGRAKLKAGIQAIIAGTDQQIHGILQILESDKKDDFDILYINETPDGYSMGYQTKTAPIAQVVSELKGNVLTMKTTAGAGVTSDSTMHFDAMPDGRLLMRSDEEHVNQPMMQSVATIKVEYQVVGGVTFPARLLTQLSMDALQSTHQDVTAEIDLHDCSIEK